MNQKQKLNLVLQSSRTKTYHDVVEYYFQLINLRALTILDQQIKDGVSYVTLSQTIIFAKRCVGRTYGQGRLWSQGRCFVGNVREQELQAWKKCGGTLAGYEQHVSRVRRIYYILYKNLCRLQRRPSNTFSLMRKFALQSASVDQFSEGKPTTRFYM